jgi:hypothetical protein
MLTSRFLLNLFFLVMLSFLVGCLSDSTKKQEGVTGSPEILNRLKANNITPATFPAKTQSLITLSYTSLDGDLAASCALSSLDNVSVSQSCSCDGLGVCIVGVTSIGGYSGAGAFSYSVVANGKTSTTGRASFTISAPPAGTNVPPTITSIAAQTTIESTPKTGITFSIADSDSTVTCANVTGTSSNTALVPNANIVISGIAPTCSVSLTPVSALIGSTNIILTLTDNGSPLPAETATSSFTLTVNAFNDPPTISSISTQLTAEDVSTGALAFTISDSDSVVNCNNVVATSSNSALVSNVNLIVGGSAPNCTISASPNLNQSGMANITLVLTDNGSPMPAKTATTIFSLNVLPVNDTPTVSTIVTQTTTENVPKNIAFTIADSDSNLTCNGNVSVISSNTALIPNTNIAVTGTAPNCVASITPLANQSGSSIITVTVTDNGTPLPVQTISTNFNMIVSPVNEAPVISAISSQITNEDTTINSIAFTISDADSTVYCSDVTGSSNNTTLVSNANIIITGTAPNCLVTIIPSVNKFGSASITLTLTDNGTPLPAETATSVFIVTVNAINDAPIISSISNQNIDEDNATSALAFTITDSDSTLTCAGSVAKSSSNTTLIPNSNITISGTAPNCTIVITPASNRNGSATITLTLTDNGTPMPALAVSTNFNLVVTPVIDLTGVLTVAANLSGVASSYTGNSYARIIKFTGISADENLTSLEVCLGTASGSCNISSWVDATGYTTGGAPPTVTLGGTYRMRSGIGGAQVFSLVKSCGTTTNYFYSVRATNASARISNVLSTPAWSFWEPTCLAATLTQWLDASENSTITVATGVSNWTDKSGSGRTVTQATTGKQPVYSLTGLGTLPGVTFNGTTSSMTRASFVYAQGSATVFSVMRAPTSATNRFVFSEGRNATTNNFYSPLMSSTTNTMTGWIVNDAATNVLNRPALSPIMLNNAIRLVMGEDTGSSFYTYSNGVAQTQPITNYTRGTSTINTFRLGANYINNVESGWFSGTIGEFMVINGTLSSANRLRLEGYTAHKWNVPGNLPGAHIYLTTPP